MKTIIAALLMSVWLAAHAQHRDFGRERFSTPHWVFDDRFHHNHFYAALGYSVGVLPAGNIALNFRGGHGKAGVAHTQTKVGGPLDA